MPPDMTDAEVLEMKRRRAERHRRYESLEVSPDDLPPGSDRYAERRDAQTSLHLHPPAKRLMSLTHPPIEYDQPRQGPTYHYVNAIQAYHLKCPCCGLDLIYDPAYDPAMLCCWNQGCEHFDTLLLPPTVPLLVVQGPCSAYPRPTP